MEQIKKLEKELNELKEDLGAFDHLYYTKFHLGVKLQTGVMKWAETRRVVDGLAYNTSELLKGLKLRFSSPTLPKDEIVESIDDLLKEWIKLDLKSRMQKTVAEMEEFIKEGRHTKILPGTKLLTIDLRKPIDSASLEEAVSTYGVFDPEPGAAAAPQNDK